METAAAAGGAAASQTADASDAQGDAPAKPSDTLAEAAAVTEEAKDAKQDAPVPATAPSALAPGANVTNGGAAAAPEEPVVAAAAEPKPVDTRPFVPIADSASMQGRGAKQEDRCVKVPDLTKAAKALKMPIDHLDQPCSLFAVYDGHRGHLCAEFTAKGFHGKLLKRLSAETNREAWTDAAVCQCLTQICEELDTEFLARHRTSMDGCSLVVTLIIGLRLFTVWVGDARCMVGQTADGQISAVTLTEDHRVGLSAETERIKKAGGAIIDYGNGFSRVAHEGYEERIREMRRAQAQGLGNTVKAPIALDLSRALGNRDFKSVNGKQLLSPTPGTHVLQLDKSHQFIALTCSGFAQVMENEDVITELDLVREPSDPTADVRNGCGALATEAYNKGSQHNLTVILVRLDWRGDGSSTHARKLASVHAAEKAAMALMEIEDPKKESAVAASKRKRLEAAEKIKSQKQASYERDRAIGGGAQLDAAEAAKKEEELKKFQAEVNAERREAARKAAAEAARRSREEDAQENHKNGGGLDAAEAFFAARKKQKKEEIDAQHGGLEAADAFFEARRAQKKAEAEAKAQSGKGLDAAEDFFAKRRAEKAAAESKLPTSKPEESKSVEAPPKDNASVDASPKEQHVEKAADVVTETKDTEGDEDESLTFL